MNAPGAPEQGQNVHFSLLVASKVMTRTWGPQGSSVRGESPRRRYIAIPSGKFVSRYPKGPLRTACEVAKGVKTHGAPIPHKLCVRCQFSLLGF